MSIVARLLLLFTLLPIVEISLLMPIHDFVGWKVTLGIICLTAITGTILTRWQGTASLNSIKKAIAEGGLPGEEILDGVLILLSGAMLITPGVLTDLVGLLVLLPFVRRPIRGYIKRRGLKWMEKKTEAYVVETYSSSFPAGGDPFSPHGVERPHISEADVIDITPE